MVQLSSCFSLGSELPKFIGEFRVEKLEYEAAVACLRQHNYGFCGPGIPFESTPYSVWRIQIEGGEIEGEIVAKVCEIM